LKKNYESRRGSAEREGGVCDGEGGGCKLDVLGFVKKRWRYPYHEAKRANQAIKHTSPPLSTVSQKQAFLRIK
jgi:hypothetical protein